MKNKYQLSTENVNNCVNYAKISGYNFQLILSNYTAKIVCDENPALNAVSYTHLRAHETLS
jgi:hypothetical protein